MNNINTHPVRVKQALISVSDKQGLFPFAEQLLALGIGILSTGGTAKQLADIPHAEVSDYTGFPEIMGGRVKTLHPKIFAGLLHRGEQDSDVLQKESIDTIQLVVVNLYPFAKTIAKEDSTLPEAIENIDIGGPSLLRAAAKNFQQTAVVCDPADYSLIIEELKTTQSLSLQTRWALAQKAFAHTAEYDASIANYLNSRPDPTASEQLPLPERFSCHVPLAQPLRYGENPHQAAQCYRDHEALPGSIAHSEQYQGKALSFNNLADADVALECVKSLPGEHACVIVKHANPCGAAAGNSPLEAYERAYATDPTSAFGGIIAFGCALDATTATKIIEQQFVEVVIAPEFSEEARTIFEKRKNLRVLCCGHWPNTPPREWDLKRIQGALLVQEKDNQPLSFESLECVTDKKPTDAEMKDLFFAWNTVRFVKSNAVVYAKDQTTLAIGAGQMSRVFCCEIAAQKAEQANLSLENGVMASDAFFPFADSIELAAQQGISAIIQPGGSKRDSEVIAAANEKGIAMVFTGQRLFRH